ncbi:MAG TPA: hypothetical protein VG733_19180, partial [Chthoniobacteraceae bacterium]|nr:hypothetical protein [Chthoniobacteraceae bacterium]
EGIYHANFVVARMHRALKHLADGGVLDAAQKEKALATLKRQKELFASGMETIRQHGKMTATGAAVIQGACDYMASVG